jgi:hypothetical protein
MVSGRGAPRRCGSRRLAGSPGGAGAAPRAQPSAPGSFAAYQAFVAGQAAYWQGRPAPEVRAFFERGMVRSPVGNDMHSDPLFDELRGDPRFELINRGERPTTLR